MRSCRIRRAASSPGDVETVFNPAVVVIDQPRADDSLTVLTARQLQVLALMAKGRSNAAIAGRLAITEKAVVRHVSHIDKQLGIDRGDVDHRRVLAVVRYLSK